MTHNNRWLITTDIYRQRTRMVNAYVVRSTSVLAAYTGKMLPTETLSTSHINASDRGHKNTTTNTKYRTFEMNDIRHAGAKETGTSLI